MEFLEDAEHKLAQQEIEPIPEDMEVVEKLLEEHNVSITMDTERRVHTACRMTYFICFQSIGHDVNSLGIRIRAFRQLCAFQIAVSLYVCVYSFVSFS